MKLSGEEKAILIGTAILIVGVIVALIVDNLN